MENKITNSYSTAISLENSSENNIEKPLSPILNKKRFSRKFLIDKKIHKRNQSLKEISNLGNGTKAEDQNKSKCDRRNSSIPVPMKSTAEFKHPADYNMKKIEDKNISDFKNEIIAKASNFSKHTSSGFETATGKSLSISESKIKKYTELFADILTDNNIETLDNHRGSRKFIKQPQSMEYKGASGDIFEETVDVKNTYNPSNLNMIYENKQFSTLPISKTTFSGSTEDVPSINTVHTGAVRVFNNKHFLSTDSSKDSVMKEFNFTQESKNTGITDAELLLAVSNIEDEFNENVIDSKKIPISQLNYNLATDDSNTTLECEIKGLEKLLEQKLDQSTRRECEKALVLCSNDSYLSGLSQDIKEILNKQKKKKKKPDLDTHPKSSKNSVFVNISPSTVSNFNFSNEFFKENKKYKGIVKTLKTVNKEDEFSGFAVEDIKHAEKMYEEYKSLVAQVEMETTYLEHMRRDKRKKCRDGIGKKSKHKKHSESSKISDVTSDITIDSQKKVEFNSKTTIDSFDQGHKSPFNNIKCQEKKEKNTEKKDLGYMEVVLDQDGKSPKKYKKMDIDLSSNICNSSTNTENNTISLASNNRVQICIGNNRIKINIKSENGSNMRTNNSKGDKDIKLISVNSETNSNQHQGQNLRNVVSNTIIPSVNCSGFKLASGKDIIISNEMMKNAQKMFDEKPKESNGHELKKSINIVEKREIESEVINDKKNENEEIRELYRNNEEKEWKNNGSFSGFKMASGKEIKVSDEMKRKAEKLFTDNIDFKSKDTNINDIKMPLGMLKNISNETSEKICEETTIENNTKDWNNANISYATSSGFKMASGKKIEISNELLQNAEKIFESITSTDTKDRKILKPKSMLKHKEGGHSRKALNFNESKDFNQCFGKAATNFTSSGFSSASGKALTISKEKFDMALSAFNDLEAEESNLSNKHNSKMNLKEIGDFDSKIQYQNSNMQDQEIKYPSKTAHELIEDVVNTYDSAIEKVSANSTPLRKIQQSLYRSPSQRSIKSFSSKRRLGTSRYKPINMHKEKLEKAKQLFDDTDKSDDSFNSTINLIGFNSTPNKSKLQQNVTSTPIGKSCEMSLDITPIKKSTDISDITNYKSSIIFHEKSCSDLCQVQNEIDKEYCSLKKKLIILEGRMIALEQQKQILESNDHSHRKQRLGILFTKKQNCSERVSLEKLFISSEENINYFNIAEHIFAVTPKNAEKLHFNISNFNDNISVIKTIDGATVIPNSSNIVGVTEINNAFRAMEGVDPKHLHKLWVSNHYKWIVWKLASYERIFPQYFKDSLSIENIIAQLKYRYDREIDNAERSALRRIMERDDVSQKRLILCVSDIILIGSNKFELELTDGWYSIKTIIDSPLCQQIYKNKIKIGTKLITQGAELLNCEGCHPLEVPDNVRLKINFNGTRRALWYTKLGYYKIPMPFPILLSNLHPEGGQISCINFYIARVYPLRYLDNSDGIKIWRNGKAEEKRAREFENERQKQMDGIKYKVLNEMESKKEDNVNLQSVDMNDIANINCAKTLVAIVQNSNDPEQIINSLSPEQRKSVLEYKEYMNNQKQAELSYKMSKQIEELRANKRNVIPLLKILIMDINEDNRTYIFNIWKPTEEHLQIIKEESCLTVFNVLVKKTGDLNTTNRTYFRPSKLSVSKKTQRQLLPIAMTVDSYYKPLFNEFDTVGLVVQLTINNFDQELWLSDFIGRLLYVKIVDGPKLCSLLDNLKVGQTVALTNLIMHKCHSNFGQALANQFSLISQYPQQKFLQHGLDIFKEQLPNDLTKLLLVCEEKVQEIKNGTDLKNITNCNNSLQHFSNLSAVIDDSGEDSSIIPSRLTMTDVAMSLIDTDQFM